MAAPMPLEAPVTTATLPCNFDMDFVPLPDGPSVTMAGLGSIVRKIGTIEPRCKGAYLEIYATVAASFDGRRQGGDHSPRSVRPGAGGDLRQYRRRGSVADLFGPGLCGGSGDPQVVAVAALQGAARGGPDPV